jgi:hypothetical protein
MVSGSLTDAPSNASRARSRAEVRACIGDARRDNRDYTRERANWMSILLLAVAALAINDRGRTRQAANEE